ncbi:hypothetical protein TRFO_04477 [Tritrichomonas foetus]|uniref:VPS9 domain-containing protein n=1 Tax=Tritrichomonas foetus TaxID=1144522 RepID=A0A1J4KEP7_9EUKA|nr:hypothetical protein TRFO_04477 [Tritrichomonas foetus]|eukprot:OHT09919.1 hypothetical protein TRFO_04477 [Tritrichomonas foetus]
MEESLPPIIKKYLCDSNEDTHSSADNIKILTNYVQKKQNEVLTLKSNYEKVSMPSGRLVYSGKRAFYKNACRFYRDACEKLIEYEENSIEDLVKIAKLAINYLKENASRNIYCEELIEEISDRLTNNSDYKYYIFAKDALNKKVRYYFKSFKLRDTRTAMRTSLVTALRSNYDYETKYVTPTIVDTVLPYFLKDAAYSCMIEPIIEQILLESVSSLVVTISEFTDMFYEDIGYSNDYSTNTMKYICYTTIVRYFFDEAYLRKPLLSLHEDKNQIFLEKCEIFAQTNIGDLNIPERIKKQYVAYLPATSLFREQHLDILTDMQYMNNPLDIMLSLLAAQKQIAKYFKDDEQPLTFKETATLMLVLMSVSPPINAVSIALFLKKWGDIHLLPECEQAKDIFIAAVELIYNLDFNDGNDEDESENGNEAKNDDGEDGDDEEEYEIEWK